VKQRGINTAMAQLPLLLLPRLALVEGGHRQLPTDQEGLSRGILDVFCSCPMVRLVPLGKPRREELFERERGPRESVSNIVNSDKLIALEVSFGDHKRTVLAGMKRERANPREIEGKQALFVVNLTPRKMAGMVSEGMLFDIGYLDGIAPVLAVPELRVPDGTRAG
jgi:tRNA-binding protein